VCAWCYSWGTCALAYDKENPLSATWLRGNNACSDWTTKSSTCECRPDVIDSCEECVAHPGCTWVKNATTYLTTTLHTKTQFFGNISTQVKRHWKDKCWAGDPFTGPHLEEDKFVFTDVNIVVNSTAHEWCWVQCHFSGPWFSIIALVVILVACCGVGALVSLVCKGVCGVLGCFKGAATAATPQRMV